jgi:hypothetical protein
LRFLAELGNGQPLALGVKALRTSSPRARIKLGSCSACLALSVLGILSLIASFSVEAKLTADHYTAQNGRAELCRFYHPITLITVF